MTNYRIFLVSFLTVSWIFLCGLNKPLDDNTVTVETQETERELHSAQTENSQKPLGTQVETKNNASSVKRDLQAMDTGSAEKDDPVPRNVFEKPLDLSVPFKDSDNADMNTMQKAATQGSVTNIFATEIKKKVRPLELKGGLLMSPEPELEKRKSVDGAGIVIHLKP